MKYQSTEVMVQLLKEAQELQLAVAQRNDGYSLHVDMQSSPNYFSEIEGYHIVFDVALFCGDSLEESWDFSGLSDTDELEATMKEMKKYISKL